MFFWEFGNISQNNQCTTKCHVKYLGLNFLAARVLHKSHIMECLTHHHLTKRQVNFTCCKVISPWAHDVNWMYIRRSEDIQDIIWTSYVRLTYVLSPERYDFTVSKNMRMLKKNLLTFSSTRDAIKLLQPGVAFLYPLKTLEIL